jgi:hypothetical protein
MWWKLVIAFLFLQIVLGVLVGRFIKLSNPTSEQQTVWKNRARAQIGRLARRLKGS